ncbi:MAG: hypothetical protein R6W67_01195, partial [Bacteroidales bacterium]
KPVVPSRNAVSNAMNVGHPSNLARIVSLYGGMMDDLGIIRSDPDMEALRRDIYSFSVSDELTLETMAKYYKDHKIVSEPHGAAALAAVDQYRRENSGIDIAGGVVISIETAHPAKFPELVSKVTRETPPVPVSLSGLNEKSEFCEKIPGRYEFLKEYLLESI